MILFADNMSDGTLKVLGVLLALFQSPDVAGDAHVVGIEEPEAALHPDAAGVMTDVLLDASQRVQVRSSSPPTVLISWIASRFRWIRSCQSFRPTENRR